LQKEELSMIRVILLRRIRLNETSFFDLKKGWEKKRKSKGAASGIPGGGTLILPGRELAGIGGGLAQEGG